MFAYSQIADDEKEYSDDEEELLAKQERNRAKRTSDPSGKSKLVNPTGGRSAYVTEAADRITARPSHPAPSTFCQQPQHQQPQRNQAHPYIARNSNQAALSNSSQPQQSHHQILTNSNKPPQQYKNCIEPPLYPQQYHQQQYQSQYGQHQHGNHMTGINRNLHGFDHTTLHGNHPSIGYSHQSQHASLSYPPGVSHNGSIQADYNPNFGVHQLMNNRHMQQQYGIPPQQYQQQQHHHHQPAYHFPSHIQAMPQGQNTSAPWPGK